MALTEHEWKCNGDVDSINEETGMNKAHETTFVITSATFGNDPTVPDCATCGQPMKKVYSIGAITYDRDWYLRRNG